MPRRAARSCTPPRSHRYSRLRLRLLSSASLSAASAAALIPARWRETHRGAAATHGLINFGTHRGCSYRRERTKCRKPSSVPALKQLGTEQRTERRQARGRGVRLRRLRERPQRRPARAASRELNLHQQPRDAAPDSHLRPCVPGVMGISCPRSKLTKPGDRCARTLELSRAGDGQLSPGRRAQPGRRRRELRTAASGPRAQRRRKEPSRRLHGGAIRSRARCLGRQSRGWKTKFGFTMAGAAAFSLAAH